MYVEEVIILLSILSSISMILKTKQVFNNLVPRYKESVTRVSSKRYFDYLRDVRNSSVKSRVGYAALSIGILNYVSSIVFVSQYMKYSTIVEDNDFDSEECEVASAFVILTYCSLF